MRLIEIENNTFINPSQVCQIRLDGNRVNPQVIVSLNGGQGIFLYVPKGQNPEKFLWVIKEWIRTGFHPYGYDQEPEDTEEPTGVFKANMLRAER
jgi:hypothetical protein